MLNRKPKLVVIGFDFTLSKPKPVKYWYTLYIKGYILKHQHPKQIRKWHRSPTTWHQCDDVDTGCRLNLWLTVSWMYHFCNRILSFFAIFLKIYDYDLSNDENTSWKTVAMNSVFIVPFLDQRTCIGTTVILVFKLDNICFFLIYIYCSSYKINWLYTYY